MPSGFTLLNLCLGMLAIIYAFESDFQNAGLCVVLGGVCDALDGRVARATGSGSRFGEELDSLADIVTFGVAPAMIMYSAVLKHERFSWLWPFIFIAAAAVRLARFNVEQAGLKKNYFYGLPSPAAGMTLATYYWFSQTTLYTESWVSRLPWEDTMRVVMFALAVLMMSNVQYPAVPAVGFRSIRGLLGTLLVVGTLAGVVFFPRQFFFPALVAYVAYGLLKTIVVGLLDRRLAGARSRTVAALALSGVPAADSLESEAPGRPPPRTSQGQIKRRRRRRRGRGEGGSGNDSKGNPPAPAS
jgi:CDP-diacylglycerol--serine O-phosphatidyltransferase